MEVQKQAGDRLIVQLRYQLNNYWKFKMNKKDQVTNKKFKSVKSQNKNHQENISRKKNHNLPKDNLINSLLILKIHNKQQNHKIQIARSIN